MPTIRHFGRWVLTVDDVAKTATITKRTIIHDPLSEAQQEKCRAYLLNQVAKLRFDDYLLVDETAEG